MGPAKPVSVNSLDWMSVVAFVCLLATLKLSVLMYVSMPAYVLKTRYSSDLGVNSKIAFVFVLASYRLDRLFQIATTVLVFAVLQVRQPSFPTLVAYAVSPIQQLLEESVQVLGVYFVLLLAVSPANARTEHSVVVVGVVFAAVGDVLEVVDYWSTSSYVNYSLAGLVSLLCLISLPFQEVDLSVYLQMASAMPTVYVLK